eukprot:TRINITY_DN26697_c0_g1_i1.p1 TRINITY_DN26697_c0_g1~~TRINITY_DN26697_c0_g1_i1.p1  ORF type:complete len:259 (+),score=36.47 TRINITY_DN26697_c0_g1_i1:25-777(+)
MEPPSPPMMLESQGEAIAPDALSTLKEHDLRPKVSLKCDRGHALQLCNCGIGLQLCDRCSRRIDTSFTYRCKICDYDLCERCYSAAKQHVRAARAQEAATAQEARSARQKRDAQGQMQGPRPPWPGAWPTTLPTTSPTTLGPRPAMLAGAAMVKPSCSATSKMTPYGKTSAKKSPNQTPRIIHEHSPQPSIEEEMASHVSKVIQGNYFNMEEALWHLSPTDKFRLTTAMMVVTQMVNPDAPRDVKRPGSI